MSARTLDLSISARSGKSFTPFLRRNLLKAHGLMRSKLVELSVALVGDAKMSALHEQFMNITGPTDVLTFPLDQDDRGNVIAGEIVICVPYALHQSKAHGTRPRDEVLLYAIHGMLHLAGHDDHDPAAFKKMHAAEDRILKKLGIGPVFRPRRRLGVRR